MGKRAEILMAMGMAVGLGSFYPYPEEEKKPHWKEIQSKEEKEIAMNRAQEKRERKKRKKMENKKHV